MLKIIIIELLAKNFVIVNKDNTIDKVDGDINNVNKTKSKNKVISNFLAKSKLLVKISSGSDFLTFKTRLVFVKLKQTFIKALILHHFDLEYHICVKINVLSYIINKAFYQLILNNLGQ